MKVLVVDDSVVFRTQICACLESNGVEVVASASNGKIALQKLEQFTVDLITLDMEMPELDGLSTLKLIREKGLKTKVIFFSTKTIRGAEQALLALSLGADDVVAKPTFDEVQNFKSAQDAIKDILLPKVLQFANCRPHQSGISTAIHPAVNISPKLDVPKKNLDSFLPKMVVIASSTGGPNILEKIFTPLKGNYKLPVLIVQHMPPVFTQILAKRLKEICGTNFKEAENNELIVAGNVYVAPGDFHMEVAKKDNKLVIKLNQGPQRNSVRPCADYLFESASDAVKSSLLSLVLTGMGEDGAVGAKKIKQSGGGVIIQNRESCIVFGMPGKVFENNDFDKISSPEEITSYLRGILL